VLHLVFGLFFTTIKSQRLPQLHHSYYIHVWSKLVTFAYYEYDLNLAGSFLTTRKYYIFTSEASYRCPLWIYIYIYMTPAGSFLTARRGHVGFSHDKPRIGQSELMQSTFYHIQNVCHESITIWWCNVKKTTSS